jgi:hypothetical protein
VTFEQLGGLGEFIGALAVLGSLVYVARQIQENSRSTRHAAMQTAMLAAQNVMSLPVRDRELARVIRVGLGTPDDLTEDEFEQFRYWLFLVLRVHEDMFVRHKAGVIDDETWGARARTVSFVFATPGGRRVWAAASNAYRTDFQAWMASSENREAPPAVQRGVAADAAH